LKPKRKRVYYLCFTQYHDRKLAIKTFVEKFAKQPAEIFVEKRILWLGPALEKQIASCLFDQPLDI
jgi:hypothetical protein